MKRILYILIILLISPFFLFAEQDELFQNRGKAGYGASFLNSPFNPYGVSTGGILCIFGNTIDSIFWNPAGLTQIENTQLQFSGANMSYDRMIGYVGFAKPCGEDLDQAFAVTALGTYVDGIYSYNENDYYLKKTQYAGSSLIITYAKHISMVKIGINVKVVNEKIANNIASGGALDFGFLVTPPLPIYLGFNIKNLPGFVKWDTEDKIYRISSGYQFGFGYKSLTDTMKFGITFSKDQGAEEMNVNVGGEIALGSLLALRFGLLNGNFSSGLGLDLGLMNIDYAFYNEQFLELDNSAHMISTRFNF